MGRAEYRRTARAIKAGKAHMTTEGAISEADVIDRRRQEAILLHVVEPEPGFVPGAYRNDLAGYVAFMEVPSHLRQFCTQAMWCPAHWAPCPVQGKDGRAASVALLKYQSKDMPPNLQSVAARTRWLSSQTTPLCCQAGDSFVDMVWAGVPVL